jgi:type IV pilus assembly protein PilM
MPLFGGPTKKSFLGVDIGAGGIKLVEMTAEKGRSRLMTYGYSQRKLAEATKSFLDNPKTAADLLSKVIKQADVKTNRVVSALPSSKVFSAIISVPRVKDEKELKPLIEAQARKLVPLPFEEMILDSKLIDDLEEKKPEKKEDKKDKKDKKKDDPKKPKGNVRVLVTGAAKTLVQKYVEMFKLAKLELVALETESFALIRSLIGKDKSPILIIDIGTIRTNLIVVEKGIPFLTRSVNIGGSIVTKKIAEQMGMEEEQAEQLKYDLAAQHKSGDVLPVVEQSMQPILNEISYTFEQYARMDTTEMTKVEKIILTGGSAHLPGMVKFIADKTGLNTYAGDPWARVSYPEDMRPVLDEIGPRMAVGIGMAMREEG